MATTPATPKKKPAAKKPAAKKSAARKSAPKAVSRATKRGAVAARSTGKKAAARKSAPRAASAPATAAAAPAATPEATPAAAPAEPSSPEGAPPPAAEKKPARKTPKVSPKKHLSVSDYTAELPAWQAEVVAELQNLINREAPEATASIKWAQPVFEISGPFAFIKPASNHITLGFWRGSDLEDPENLLEGSGDRMRHVKLASLQEAQHPALGLFVRRAVELNREKGDPTKDE